MAAEKSDIFEQSSAAYEQEANGLLSALETLRRSLKAVIAAMSPGDLLLLLGTLLCLGVGTADFLLQSTQRWEDRPALTWGNLLASPVWRQDSVFEFDGGWDSQFASLIEHGRGSDSWAVGDFDGLGVVDMRVIPGNGRIVTLSGDGIVRHWSSDLAFIEEMERHDGVPPEVTFLADDAPHAFDISASFRRQLALGPDLTERPKDTEPVSVDAVALRPGSDSVAIQYSDGSVLLPDGSTAFSSPAVDEPWQSSQFQYAPDGSFLVSTYDSEVTILSQDGQLSEIIGSQEATGLALAISEQGLIALGKDDGRIERYAERGEPVEPSFETAGPVKALAFSPDGLSLASGGADGTIQIWSLEGDTEREFRAAGPIVALAFSPDGETIYASVESGAVIRWYVDGDLLAEVMSSSTVEITAVSSDRSVVAVSDIVGEIRLFDVDGQFLASSFDATDSDKFSFPDSLALAEDGRLLAVLAEPQDVTWFYPDDFSEPLTGILGSPTALVFTADDVLVLGTDEGVLYLSYPSGQLATEIYRAQDRISAVDVSSDGRTIAAVEDSGGMVVLDRNGALIRQVYGGGHPTTAPVFSHDGNFLAAAVQDASASALVIYALTETTPSVEIFHGEAPLTALAFSPDNEFILAGSENGSVTLWRTSGEFVNSHEFDGFPVLEIFEGTDERPVIITSNGQVTFMPRTGIAVPALLPSLLMLIGFVAFLRLRPVLSESFRLVSAIPETVRPSVQDNAVAIFLESDSPVEDRELAGEDLGHVADQLSSFIKNPNVTPPLTFALTGDWGSGKSSLMKLVQGELKDNMFPCVWFNAWHHQSETHLFAALMEAIRREALPPFLSFRNIRFRLTLAGIRFLDAPIRTSVRFFGLFVFIALLATAVFSPAVREMFVEADLLQQFAAGGIGVLIGASLLWQTISNLVLPFGVRPASLVQDSAGLFRLARFSSRLSFRQRFGRAFHNVCRAFGDRRLVIIIDDLDRCKPELVVQLLEAVNFLASNGDCFVIMGINEKPVLTAVGLSFKEMALAQAAAWLGRAESQAAEKEEDAKAQLEYADEYLEKLINIKIRIPKFDARELVKWMTNSERSIRHKRTSRPAARWFVAMIFGASSVAGGSVYWASTLPPFLVSEVSETAASIDNGAAAVAAVLTEAAGGTASGDTVSPRPAALDTTSPGIPETAAAQRDPIGASVRQAAAAEASASQISEEMRTAILWAGIVGAGLLAAGLLFPGLRQRAGQLGREAAKSIESDSQEFRDAFAKWAPLVLAKNDSPRAVKRFANRMRYLNAGMRADPGTSMIGEFMAIGALEETKLIDHDLPWEKWSSKDIGIGIATAFDDANMDPEQAPRMPRLTKDHWQQYQKSTSGVRFSNYGVTDDVPKDIDTEASSAAKLVASAE